MKKSEKFCGKFTFKEWNLLIVELDGFWLSGDAPKQLMCSP
jgi:hypothetical protein